MEPLPAISQEIKQKMAEEWLAAGLFRLLDETLTEGLSPQRISEVFLNLIKNRGDQR